MKMISSIFSLIIILTVLTVLSYFTGTALSLVSSSTPLGASGLSASSLTVDAPKFANIVPPELAHNASTAVIVSAANANLLANKSSVNNSTNEPWFIDRRLPKDVRPEHYDVEVHPNLDTGYFNGKVACIFTLTTQRQFIQLHSSKLNITAINILQLLPDAGNSTVNAPSLQIEKYFSYLKNEFLIVKLTAIAQPGRYSLHISYNGSMLGKINGLYRSAYTSNNQTKYMAVSQMGPTYTRQAFPCFDEPIFKATFNISISHAADKTALSNMPEIERVQLDSIGNTTVVLTRFAKTPPMSTYLTAIVVNDFKFIETNSTSGTRLRAYGTAEQIEKGSLQWALEVLKFAIGLCEKYFEIPYQLPKLDIIGVPDFFYGAMENWGCILFRDRFLVYDAAEASAAAKQDVATVVAHEVAHQWFGNLVTIAWWDSLWLKESFAVRMEFYMLAEAEKYLPKHEWFVSTQMQRALKLDSLASSHPIVVPSLTDSAEISALFDDIPYLKGASTIVMLENFMGAETFRKGVVKFLRKHSFSTASADDMWLVLTEQLAENCVRFDLSPVNTSIGSVAINPVRTQCVDVKRVMDTWLLQMNYPLLSLKELNETHGQVKQERFLLSSDNSANETIQYPSPFNFSWNVPITVRDISGKQHDLVWLNESSGAIEWPAGSDSTNGKQNAIAPSILLNVNRTGFYRVNYPLSLWMTLSDRLAANITAIPDARERSGLISDAFALARASLLPYSVPFSLFRFLKQERSLAVWQTASDAFEFLDARLQAVPEVYYLWKELILSTTRPALTELGWVDNGSSQQQQLRELLLYLSCRNGELNCLANVRQMFYTWLYNNTSVPPNFRSVVYKFGMQYAENDQPWQLVLQRLTSTTHSKTPQEIRLMLTALASSSQPWQIERLLYLAWNETYVRLQDLTTLYDLMTTNPVALPSAWSYYRSKLPRLVEKLSLNDAYLGRLPLSFAVQFNTQSQLDEMKSVFDFSFPLHKNSVKYPEAGAGRLSRRQALETIDNNVAWLQRHNETVMQLLLQQAQLAER